MPMAGKVKVFGDEVGWLLLTEYLGIMHPPDWVFRR